MSIDKMNKQNQRKFTVQTNYKVRTSISSRSSSSDVTLSFIKLVLYPLSVTKNFWLSSLLWNKDITTPICSSVTGCGTSTDRIILNILEKQF